MNYKENKLKQLKNTLLSNKSFRHVNYENQQKDIQKKQMDFSRKNFVYTEKGIQMVKDGLKNLRPFKLTDTQENIKNESR